jgi:hypothetical protein
LNGTLGWTNIAVQSGNVEFGGVRRVDNLDGTFAFCALGVTTVDYLDQWLATLWSVSTPTGNGGIFIVLQDGRLLGSSLQQQKLAGVDVTTSDHPFLSVIGAVMLQQGLVSRAVFQPIVAQTLGYEAAPADVEYEATAHISGDAYHLLFSTANDRGLNWINVIVTRDSEFTSVNTTFLSINTIIPL